MRFSVPHTATAGFALMTAAMFVAPVMDVLSKILSQTISPGQVTLGRFVAQTAILVPLVLVTSGMTRPGLLHLVAGCLLAIALISINIALQAMPVANALAIFFVEPLILTLLSVPILGERLGWRRLLAVLAGLAGAMVVLRPNLAAYGWAAAAPLVTAFAFAGYMLATRVLTQRGSRLAMQMWTGLVAMTVVGIATLIATPLGIEKLALGPMGWSEAWLLLGIGVIACVSHQMIAHALARAEAGQLAPLQYLEIVSAVIFGWLVFGDFPDEMTWLGTAIIVSAGLYVIERERRLARAAAPVPPPAV